MADKLEELKAMEPVVRTKEILKIEVLEKLIPEEEGVELNEGYNYAVDGSIPQLADGIAKMCIEMDKDKSMGEAAGGGFLTLIQQYYLKLKE